VQKDDEYRTVGTKCETLCNWTGRNFSAALGYVATKGKAGGIVDGFAVGCEPPTCPEQRLYHCCWKPAVCCRTEVNLEIATLADGADEQVNEAGGVCSGAALIRVCLCDCVAHLAVAIAVVKVPIAVPMMMLTNDNGMSTSA
jgi:hypothetical protein